MVTTPFSLSSPEVRADPYPVYRRLREEDPVHWSEAMDAWVLTRYDDVVSVLQDKRFSAERRGARNRYVQEAMAATEEHGGPVARANTMLSADPPEHTRMRLLISKAFLPRAVEKLRPHIQQIADELLDDAPEPGRLDILMDLAYPLPVIVIAELMGVPTEDRDKFKRWSDDVVATLGGGPAPEIAERGAQSGRELADYFRGVIADRRREPKEDLVSVLVAATDQGDVLSEEQLVATCVVALIAGSETTRNLIANGMLALLRNPDQLEKLWQDPSLVESAVEEILRYAGPVQGTARVATEDVEIDGKTIKEGQLVFTLVAAANRDPAHFTDPEQLDIAREHNHHVAFGAGIHACLGQPLARLEARITFDTLARRIPNPKLAIDQVEWGPSFILRGMKSLPITFDA